MRHKENKTKMDDYSYFELCRKRMANEKILEKNTKHCRRKSEKCNYAIEKKTNDKCRNIKPQKFRADNVQNH